MTKSLAGPFLFLPDIQTGPEDDALDWLEAGLGAAKPAAIISPSPIAQDEANSFMEPLLFRKLLR